ncbi:MAG: excinuclease ABC subunit UvrC [Clostridia bacterium]|nr:excinuclease ABC subunit UvrC [Clostridia bacterium]
MTFEELKEKAHRLPTEPGVYLMHDKSGTVIYVGKAKVLRNRVSQYFADLASHTLKTRRMVSNIDSFETIFAATELDALLLENTLIKKYKPKYNILLKDDKGYPFIRIEAGAYPRLTVANRREQDGARYFGPYGGRGTANHAIRLLSETFLLPSCSRRFPRDIGKERPCLQLDMGKCCGVCTGKISEEEYDRLIAQCQQVLEGKSEELSAQLQEQMEQAAEDMEFERAAVFRDRIRAIERLRQSRIAVVTGGADTDALAFALRGSRACIVRLSYRSGILVDRTSVLLDGLDEGDAADALESFIQQYYTKLSWAPKLVCLSHALEEPELVEEYLTSLRGTKCALLFPQKGEKRREVQLALDNAALELAEAEDLEQRTGKTLQLLQQMLGLPEPPRRMESFDISNTMGSDPVASMVVFQNGKPLKSAYKKFKIKTAQGGDDYGSMAEVIGRRLDRALAGDESFLPLPDIFLIDGGAGQAQIALEQLRQRGLELAIPVYGMVKDDHHRTRALVTAEGQEFGIAATPAVFALLGRLQEEVHRFAIEYHRSLRGKRMRRSSLNGIPGLGEAREKKLLRRFGTVRAVAAASVEELSSVLPGPVAQAVYDHFKEKQS